MTVGNLFSAHCMPVGGSSSRSGRLARISQSNIRPFGSGTYGGGLGPGGQPLSGPDPTSPAKKDVKHRFEITKKLGSGTYGKVSLAFDHKFEREVAVKLIKKSAIENRADLVRIRREIRIMSALNHPNIIQIFEVFENKDKIILVMEYACGGELYDYVSQFGSLPESEARRIFRQITSAVLYCHKHQVAHRDLKLENILLDQDNNAKIADFGLSNYFSDKSLLATFCGSPLYASPEIINGTPYRGPEVDCWSLGILLYTLVYGSMPFDGRDFNRMVRQIKRGAYYEPDTPSTASMLIRNMLRVNPDRRADIFDIASHWWLNLEENMPVIQELPENQITDHTPLTERAETMIVQDLADETDVFMEFGHLSSETRKKIEEFRRRRKEAEEYNENSPVKPPKARKTENDCTQEEMRIEEKSLREIKEKKKEEPTDPLERLRQIENRLGQQRSSSGTKQIAKNGPQAMSNVKEKPIHMKTSILKDDQSITRTGTGYQELAKNGGERNTSPEQPEDPKPARTQSKNRADSRPPLFVPVNDSDPPINDRRGVLPMRPSVGSSTYRIETDSLNMLMNQVLEQMEKGPVSLNLVARIKAHPLYDTRPMVKELLESIIAAQPVNVQKQTSKIIQQSQDVGRRSSRKNVFDASHSVVKRIDKSVKANMEERPWHSIEVGFDPDEESDMDVSLHKSIISTSTEITVQDTSFEDTESIKEEEVQRTATNIVNTQTQTDKQAEEDSEEDSEEYTDSEMEELADEVEQEEHVTPLVVSEVTDSLPPPDPIVESPSQFSNTFDRGLIKRQSKGKYQHNRVDMYGRGVSTECDSPIMPRKLFGGPQPTPEQSPFLFDKAKTIIMQYPRGPNLSELEEDLFKKKRKNLLKTHNAVHQGEDVIAPTLSCVGSVPPRTPPPLKSDQEESDDDINEEEEVSEEDSEEQSDEEIENRKPRGPVIGAIRKDGHKIETMTVEIPGRKSSFMQSAPASIHASPSPEPTKLTSPTIKYYLTSAEMNLKPSIEPKPYTRIPTGGSNKFAIQKKVSEYETQMKESRESLPLEERLFYTNPLFRPSFANSDLFPRIPASTTDTHGKENWESAAAYIRRKNRERRYRNRTIGTPEEVQRAFDRSYVETPFSGERRMSPSHYRFSPISADSVSSHTGTTGSSHINYIYSRFHDENYWVNDHHDRPLSPTRFSTNTTMREERRSFSTHDTSPDCSEYRVPGYSINDCRSYQSSNMSPSYHRKFGQDTTTLKSWAAEPRRFEVYKTRAERDAERNTMSTPLSYRPSSYCSTVCDRPLTSYGYQKKEDFHKPENYRVSDNYRNKFDENSSYKRSICDMEKFNAVNLNPDHYTGYTSNTAVTESAPSAVLNRFRPKTCRVASALSEGDKKTYTRTRSMDRKQLRGEDHDYGSQIRNRLTTPEVIPDYTYINYHDSSNGRSGSQTKDDRGQPKSILKNKQNAEAEPRADCGNNRPVEGGIGPVRSVFVRLRRHLSLEKSASPQRQTILPRIQEAPGVSAQSLGGNLKDSLGPETNEDYPKKKRSILAFNRRRTSEMRLGTEGKLVTNGYDDFQFKRPSSPIDKLKSLFRKTDSIQTPQHTSGDYYVLGRYSGGAKDKVFGVYPSSHTSGAREAYATQYRRYPGSSSRDPSAALNRYSYTPGMTEQRRHWHDDYNIF